MVGKDQQALYQAFCLGKVMSITTRVLSYRDLVPEEFKSVILGRGCGAIGRSSDNHLILAEDCISRKHAEISCQNGHYYLKDTSTNGTLICDKELVSPTRRRRIASARVVVGHIAIRYLMVSGSNVARRLKVDHSTISRAVQRVEKDQDLIEAMRKMLDGLETKVSQQ
jgi:predicted component of type VI protein secretion system